MKNYLNMSSLNSTKSRGPNKGGCFFNSMFSISGVEYACLITDWYFVYLYVCFVSGDIFMWSRERGTLWELSQIYSNFLTLFNSLSDFRFNTVLIYLAFSYGSYFYCRWMVRQNQVRWIALLQFSLLVNINSQWFFVKFGFNLLSLWSTEQQQGACTKIS